MTHKMYKIINKSHTLKALLKPFNSFRTNTISSNNKVVDAYIYDRDNKVSKYNVITNAQINFESDTSEGDK